MLFSITLMEIDYKQIFLFALEIVENFKLLKNPL